MWLGIVLLVAAMAWLMSSWSRLSKSVQVVSDSIGREHVLGRVYFSLAFPDVLRDRITSIARALRLTPVTPLQELLSQCYAHTSRRTALSGADVLAASFDVGGLSRSAPAGLRVR